MTFFQMFLSTKKGYVYFNSATFWTDSKFMSHKYADHTKVCIGKILFPGSIWTDDPRMHPNSNYFKLFDVDKLPETPDRADSISVGVLSAVSSLSTETGLSQILTDVFGEEDSRLILDLSMYMLVQESAVFQHYPPLGQKPCLVLRKDSK